MYNNIAQKTTEKFIKLRIIKNDEFEIYKYGFELLFALSFTTLIMIIISFISHRFIETILYLLGFFVVRIICGGYHAKHHHTCFLMTISSHLLFLIIHYFFEEKTYLSILTIFLTVLSFIVILAFAPIEHHNNPMTKYRKNKNRFLSIILSVIIMLISIVSLFFETVLRFSLPFCIGSFFAAFSIFVAKLKIGCSKRKEEQ